MALIKKIGDLCEYNGLTITKLESVLGYGHGSIPKTSPGNLRSDRVREIADYFCVTPTYLMTDMKFCVCPVCGTAYDPLDKEGYSKENHQKLHENYLKLRDKIGYLMNPTEASAKREVAKSCLELKDEPDDGKVFHYETMIQCDFAEYAYANDFLIETSYPDFIKQQLRMKKYFELLPNAVIKNVTSKYDIDPDSEDTPLIDLFQTDKEFMSNITDLWDLPQALRLDVYKAIRHAKRDYADKEYYTNPYANVKK